MMRSQTFGIVVIVFVLALSCPVNAGKLMFSIDTGSPEVPGVFSGADILSLSRFTPYMVHTAAELGLLAGEEVDAFSDSSNVIVAAGSLSYVYLGYSISPASVGVVGVITDETVGPMPFNGGAGDVFSIRISGLGMTIGPTFLLSDAPNHGLTPLPMQSNIDSLNFTGSDAYFSVDPATAVALTGRGVVSGPADILNVPNPDTGGRFRRCLRPLLYWGLLSVMTSMP